MEQGIAGGVATSGVVANIHDAYENPNFNQVLCTCFLKYHVWLISFLLFVALIKAIDKKSGYRTKAILCLPIKNDDLVIGVLQLINKVEGAGIFDAEDEEIMVTFLNIAGPILFQSSLYTQLQGKSRKDDHKETVGATTPIARKARDSIRLSGLTEGVEEGQEGDEEEAQF